MKTTCSFAPETTSGERASGSVLELSATGLFIATNSLWPPQTSLRLLLTIPGERLPVLISGNVEWARTRDPAGMFVRFTGDAADAPARERILERVAATTVPPAVARLASES